MGKQIIQKILNSRVKLKTRNGDAKLVKIFFIINSSYLRLENIAIQKS